METAIALNGAYFLKLFITLLLSRGAAALQRVVQRVALFLGSGVESRAQ